MILSSSSATKENGRDALHRIAAHYQEFSIEHEFLLELCGGAHPGRSEELECKAQQIDWNHLFAITPPDLYGYLGYKLREAGLDRHCPALLVKDARNACLATAAQWLRLRFELRRLATEFAQHHVDFLLLKGAVLAFLAFPDSSLRSVSDIDVLVHGTRVRLCGGLPVSAALRASGPSDGVGFTRGRDFASPREAWHTRAH
jgi:hypothetical protein